MALFSLPLSTSSRVANVVMVQGYLHEDAVREDGGHGPQNRVGEGVPEYVSQQHIDGASHTCNSLQVISACDTGSAQTYPNDYIWLLDR